MQIKLTASPAKGTKLEELLQKRYSCRDFKDKGINLDDLASLLWAACGKKYDAVTGASRTIPSAGATNPLELYVVIGNNGVTELQEGVYHYLIEEQALRLIAPGDRRAKLSSACLGQGFIKEAPLSLVIAAEFKRTSQRYGERAQRYVYMESGHAAQNIYLAVAQLGLNTVEVGAFSDQDVKETLELSKEDAPLLVMPIGYAK